MFFFSHSLATPAPAPLPEPPLTGFQIMLIICAILFLSLLLLGLGCSYMCLKRRNVRVIHRHPFGSGSGSEITKLSTSSLSNITMFEGLKIPRAHALLHAPPSTTGSDANLMIDHSLPSDYPSESSEVNYSIHIETYRKIVMYIFDSEIFNDCKCIGLKFKKCLFTSHL